MRRIDRLRGGTQTEERFGLGDLAGALSPWGAMQGITTTWGKSTVEQVSSGYSGLAAGAYMGNGVVFSVMLARHLLFSEARFQWQQLRGGRPGDLFGDPSLAILERPWTNGTTGDLLARMEQDVSLAGNAFIYRDDSTKSLRRLRPDWVQVVLGSPSGDPHDLNATPRGYIYKPPGSKGQLILPEFVAHYAPVPDPTAAFKGMSWITPVIREIQADFGATQHKERFFANAATPNMAVRMDQNLTAEQFREFTREMDKQHKGADNAYKTLYLAGAADLTVVGADMKQLDFKVTQGAGETRICAAGGVPPVIVGLSEGLQSATYSNYGMARRLFGDHWARPHWRAAAGALESIVPPPPGARLWYDDRDVSFLQEDRKDDAEIAAQQATTIKTLVDGGFEPSTVVQAVLADDYSMLKHSGLMSVQLLPPGTTGGSPPANV